MTDEKGNKIVSNWKSVRTQAEIDTDNIDTFIVYIFSPGTDERRFFRDKTRAVDVRSWQEIEDINMRGAMKGRI